LVRHRATVEALLERANVEDPMKTSIRWRFHHHALCDSTTGACSALVRRQHDHVCHREHQHLSWALLQMVDALFALSSNAITTSAIHT
jgi:hypothetical protein